MEDHGQTDTPAAPMAATAAFVDALATTTHVADVVGAAHAADLVVLGEQLPTSDAAPGQSDDGGVEETGGGLQISQLGYLYAASGGLQVIPPIWIAEDGGEAHFLCLSAQRPWPALRHEWVREALTAAGV